MDFNKLRCLLSFHFNSAVAEAQEEADALVAVLRHQIQHHVPPTWLQNPMVDENTPGNDGGGVLMDSVDGIIHTIEQRVSGACNSLFVHGPSVSLILDGAGSSESVCRHGMLQVNESRLRTFFELIGRSKQFSPKIPELLARNRGNEEAFFAALSKRYGCTVTPYRKVREGESKGERRGAFGVSCEQCTRVLFARERTFTCDVLSVYDVLCRKVDDNLLDAYREVMGPSKPHKITTTL